MWRLTMKQLFLLIFLFVSLFSIQIVSMQLTLQEEAPLLDPETFNKFTLGPIHEQRGSIIEIDEQISEYCRLSAEFDKRMISKTEYRSYKLVCLSYIRGPKEGSTDCSLRIESHTIKNPTENSPSHLSPTLAYLRKEPGEYKIDCSFYIIMRQRLSSKTMLAKYASEKS